MYKNGIHVNRKVISRLSGPVSFHYLHPPPDKPDYPIIMLLGDTHGSFNLCNKCDCEHEEECCLTIYDSKFLREIDLLAEKYPVDFFTESSHEHPLSYGDETQVLFHHLQKNVKNCYDVSKRSTSRYLQECPTQFIRWHHSDIRHMYRKTVEGQLMLPTHHFRTLKNRSGTSIYFETFAKTLSFTRELIHLDNLDIGSMYAQVITDILFSFVDQNEDEEKKEEIEERNDREMIRKTRLMIGFTFSLLEKYDSVFIKQIKKEKENTEKWMNIILDILLSNESYTHSFHRFLNYFYEDIELSMMFRDVLKNTYRMDKPYYNVQEYGNHRVVKNIKYINDFVSEISSLFLFFTSTFLDVYTIARTFKIPFENDRSVLMIGYFGKDHSSSIANILLTHMKYSRIQSINGENRENCIQFSNPIYLQNDIDALALHRYSLYPERLQQYQTILATERHGREKGFYIGKKKTKKRKTSSKKKNKSGKNIKKSLTSNKTRKNKK